MVFDPEFLKPFPSLVRYFNTMIHQPAFAKVIGKVEMCTQCMQYNRAQLPARPATPAPPRAAASFLARARAAAWRSVTFRGAASVADVG